MALILQFSTVRKRPTGASEVRSTTEGQTMMKMGDAYVCSNAECNCRVQVTRSAREGSDESPRCCCGSEMQPETVTSRP